MARGTDSSQQWGRTSQTCSHSLMQTGFSSPTLSSTRSPFQKLMSVEVAALVIQSWFRGYLVRRTEPALKSKFRELKAQISDADYAEYARQNSDKKVKLTENIMNLLFRLDGVQDELDSLPTGSAERDVTPVEVLRSAAQNLSIDDSAEEMRHRSVNDDSEQPKWQFGTTNSTCTTELSTVLPAVNHFCDNNKHSSSLPQIVRTEPDPDKTNSY
ncbi:unnamed protein product [Calypogeia fissa]